MIAHLNHLYPGGGRNRKWQQSFTSWVRGMAGGFRGLHGDLYSVCCDTIMEGPCFHPTPSWSQSGLV